MGQRLGKAAKEPVIHNDRQNAGDFSPAPESLLWSPVAEDVAPFIGTRPTVDMESLTNLTVTTREGFDLLVATFPDKPVEALQSFVSERRASDANSLSERAPSSYLVSQCVQEFASEEPYREKLARQYRPPDAAVGQQLPGAADYLRSLACAAAADLIFQTPTPDGAAPSDDEDNAECGGGYCELCGDMRRESQLAACSHSHSVCTYCLRSYVAYTHGLQMGLRGLKCLAFHEDPGDTLPGSRLPRLEGRCSGSYSLAPLQACLRPTELLTLCLADAVKDARIAAGSSVPFGCQRCGHRCKMPIAELHQTLSTPLREKRVGGCGLRVRWVNAGPSPVACPAAGCGLQYCGRCGRAAHPGTMCSANVQDRKLLEWVEKRKKVVQRCPACRLVIEKHGGCKYMLCPTAMGGCGHEWCWACREEYVGLHRCGKVPHDYEE